MPVSTFILKHKYRYFTFRKDFWTTDKNQTNISATYEFCPLLPEVPTIFQLLTYTYQALRMLVCPWHLSCCLPQADSHLWSLAGDMGEVGVQQCQSLGKTWHMSGEVTHHWLELCCKKILDLTKWKVLFFEWQLKYMSVSCYFTKRSRFQP